MSARSELAATIEGALDRSHGIIAWAGPAQEDIADAILAAGYSKPHTITLPDRDDLAFKLFRADNSSASIALCIEDFHKQKADQGEQFYVYPLANVAIEAFKRASE